MVRPREFHWEEKTAVPLSEVKKTNAPLLWPFKWSTVDRGTLGGISNFGTTPDILRKIWPGSGISGFEALWLQLYFSFSDRFWVLANKNPWLSAWFRCFPKETTPLFVPLRPEISALSCRGGWFLCQSGAGAFGRGLRGSAGRWCAHGAVDATAARQGRVGGWKRSLSSKKLCFVWVSVGGWWGLSNHTAGICRRKVSDLWVFLCPPSFHPPLGECTGNTGCSFWGPWASLSNI